ncbi:HGGxSTG domain-containing protein [Cognatiluteimonas profundi]|uniref:HGGxSTG domain-containing protein n=1 Tax=Cognatiluteimonas profundi TaxID=2594501 RepID=UPI0018EEE92C|nr:HGGxSTG domain-containing protein [Lysobacter profundi]
MSDGYLSKDRAHLAKMQRARRARLVRIDYTPSPQALAAIDSKRGPYLPLCTNSGVIDAIVIEWAELTGIKYGEVEAPMTSADAAGISAAIRAPAREFGSDLPSWGESWLAENRAKQASRRVICGARRHRDGKPCQAKSQPGKQRCKWHGGCATGPRTPEGKLRALANLKQHRQRPR